MMAKQVRPWQGKPNSHRERKARQADQAPASLFHQGHKAYCFDQKSGSMAAISICVLSSIECLAKRGRPSMCKNSIIFMLIWTGRHFREENPTKSVFPPHIRSYYKLIGSISSTCNFNSASLHGLCRKLHSAGLAELAAPGGGRSLR